MNNVHNRNISYKFSWVSVGSTNDKNTKENVSGPFERFLFLFLVTVKWKIAFYALLGFQFSVL